MRKGTLDEKEEVFAIAIAIAPRTPTGDDETRPPGGQEEEDKPPT